MTALLSVSHAVGFCPVFCVTD